MARNKDFTPIEDYFIIGDLRTAALVSAEGSIDWLCLPYFDSPSVFGKVLDPSAGCLKLDMPKFKIRGEYIEDTAIVEFKLDGEESKAAVRDFMVPHPTKNNVKQQLVRQIRGLKGRTNIRFKFQPKPGYSSGKPFVIKQLKSRLVLKIDGGAMVAHTPEKSVVKEKDGYYEISIPVEENQTEQLVIEYVPKELKSEASHPDLEEKTRSFWDDWVDKGQYIDFCRGYLVRSAITLKLMQFYPTGALVAAPTTSLPEEIGGVRNWDYRYVWIRDATFALYSFYVLGYDEEARHFFDFIERVTEKCASDKFDVSLMYTIWGNPIPKEKSLKNLEGYEGSIPVRIGNDAAKQFQLDVYGALIDAFYFASKRGLTKLNKEKWRELITQLVRKIDELWQKSDHGIWEARIGTRHYTYSKVMAWVGADRANRLKKSLGLSDDALKICSQLADSINSWIWDNCFKGGVLVQHPKTNEPDATNFLFVLLQFLDKREPLTKKIIEKTAEELSHNEVFVFRYLKKDGLPGGEGAFILCSFWMISALAILEDVEPAIKIFNWLEKYMKPHGLLSEEVDPEDGSYLGNYPQTFSHMGYIMSAYYLNKYAKRKGIKLDQAGLEPK